MTSTTNFLPKVQGFGFGISLSAPLKSENPYLRNSGIFVQIGSYLKKQYDFWIRFLATQKIGENLIEQEPFLPAW